MKLLISFVTTVMCLTIYTDLYELGYRGKAWYTAAIATIIMQFILHKIFKEK